MVQNLAFMPIATAEPRDRSWMVALRLNNAPEQRNFDPVVLDAGAHGPLYEHHMIPGLLMCSGAYLLIAFIYNERSSSTYSQASVTASRTE